MNLCFARNVVHENHATFCADNACVHYLTLYTSRYFLKDSNNIKILFFVLFYKSLQLLTKQEIKVSSVIISIFAIFTIKIYHHNNLRNAVIHQVMLPLRFFSIIANVYPSHSIIYEELLSTFPIHCPRLQSIDA